MRQLFLPIWGIVFGALLCQMCRAGEAATVLSASDADITGGAKYYSSGDFIGSWTDPKSVLRWTLVVDADCEPAVTLNVACAPGCGGDFALSIGGQLLKGTVVSTGDWYAYQPMPLGNLKLAKGTYTVSLKAAGPFNTALLNLRSITLRPFTGSVKPYLPPRHPGPIPSAYVVPNFHPASCGWLDDWSLERNYCANSYLRHLDRVDSDPAYNFVMSECNNMIAIANFQPQRFEELKQRIKEGRVELVNGFFLETTMNLSGGEALAKSGIEGLRWQEQVMGTRPRFGWMIDICGTHDQLPQICSLLNLDGMVYTRRNKSGKTLFWSESPDGTRILSMVPGHYSEFSSVFSAKGALSQKQMIGLEADLAGKTSQTPVGAPVLVLGGNGDYSLPPANPKNPSQFLSAWKVFRADVPVQFTTLSKYVDTVRPLIDAGKVTLTTVRGGTAYDFDSFWIETPRVKSWYRRDEHALQAAETAATIASLKAGTAYPVQDLYHAWLQMFLNADRNTLWGSAGGMVFEDPQSWDAKDRFQWVEQKSEQTIGDSIKAVSGQGADAVLYNAANWDRDDVLRLSLAAGTRIKDAASEICGDGSTLCRIKVPSAGVLGVKLENIAAAAPTAIALPQSIETNFYSARIDPVTGALTSLRLKPSGREMLSGPANVIVAERHSGHGSPGDFTDPRPRRQRLGTSSDSPSVISATKGDLATTITITGTFAAGGVKRVMRFYNDSPRIDCETDLTDVPNLTVVVSEFPLTESPVEIRRGVPFGFSDGAWATPNPALPGWAKGIVPAVRYTDYSYSSGGGVALLDRGVPGREIDDKTPIIYLCNANDKYYTMPNAWMNGKGTHHFEYALLAHDADWKTARVPQQAWEYNCPVIVAAGCAAVPAESFVATSPNLIAEVMRRDRGEIELRLEECVGEAGDAQVTLNLPHSDAAMTDLVGGHRVELGGTGPTYHFKVRPQQIITLRFKTAVPVQDIVPLMSWDELVPAGKLAALHHYRPEVVGFPSN
jgi:alpha-mannosidase